jgi:cell wall-associated NlpC family hydrolase
LRLSNLSAVFCSLTIVAVSAPSALANGPGGVVAAPPAAPGATTTAAPAVHTFPVTARSRSVLYKGPVYLKNAAGEVVPYVAASATSASVTAPVAQETGGAVATPAAETSNEALTASLGPVGPADDGGPLARPELLVPGITARYVDGIAAAPMSAPAAVQQMIWAGNELIGLPYIYGGGHGSFISPGYDCSGTVSFALHGAGLLATPEDSGEFEGWGGAGPGRWVTIFANGGHAYMTVAGLRLDTSAADDPSNQQGPRWRPLRPANAGFVVRHPVGL